MTRVAVLWPHGAPPLSMPNMAVSAMTTSSSAASFVVAEGGAATGPVSVLFVASGGSSKWKQTPVPTLFGTWQAVFSNSRNGVAVGGQPADGAWQTTDGGRVWLPLGPGPARKLSGLRPGIGEKLLSTPVTQGTATYLAVNDGAEVTVYRSAAGGAPFEPFATRLRWLQRYRAAIPIIAVSAHLVLLAPQGSDTIYATTGHHWHTPAATGLTGGISALATSGPHHALIWSYLPCREKPVACPGTALRQGSRGDGNASSST